MDTAPTVDAENQRLAGTKDTMPPLERAGGVLGRIQKTIDSANEAWFGGGEGGGGINDTLVEIQGATGRSGKLDDVRDAIRSYTTELADLAPAAVRAAAPAGEAAPTGEAGEIPGVVADLQNFGAQILELVRGGSNIRRLALPSFAGGGIVPGPLGEPLPIVAHGQEVIFDKRTGNVQILVRQKDWDGQQKVEHKHVHQHITMVEPPATPHLWAKDTLAELKAL